MVIPAINVSAGIQPLGITPKGEMEVPSNTVDVGWFKLGTLPGEKGSAIIAGHYDGGKGQSGVFTKLNELRKGDKLFIEDSLGKTIAFIVRQTTSYDPGYADEVFSRNDATYLNLTTCDR